MSLEYEPSSEALHIIALKDVKDFFHLKKNHAQYPFLKGRFLYLPTDLRFTNQQERDQCYACGVQGMIPKPINIHGIATTVSTPQLLQGYLAHKKQPPPRSLH